MERGGGRLEGRVAVVTGASRGLGRAMALAFATEGAAVAVVARTEQQWSDKLPGTIHETVAEIEARGGNATAIAADLAQEADVERVVGEAHAAYGRVDILVNNAAVTAPGRPGSTAPPAPRARKARPRPGFADFPLKGYRLHLEIGLFAAYRLMQLVLPDMIARGRGAIVNVSSDAAFRPGPGPYADPVPATNAAYGGTKAALQHLTQSVASEVAAHGVRVNALLPSLPIATPGLLALSHDIGEEESADAFAEAAVRLCIESPASYTGQICYSDDVLHPEREPRGWLGSV
jgi:NAD(P)-dependent dehydrogenase (short-subunit alcohol dehydrogenase family)